MRYTFAVSVLAVGILFAQKPTGPHEDCPVGECQCVRRTEMVVEEYFDRCKKYKPRSKDWKACMAEIPTHCQIVLDRSGKYPHPYIPCEASDGPDCGTYQDETGDTVHTDMIDGRCLSHCKVHTCRCDDGPVCRDVQ